MFSELCENNLAFVGISVFVALSACSDSFDSQSNSDYDENVSVPIPDAIAQTRINTEELNLSVLINGQNVPMMPPDSGDQAAGTTWAGTISVPVGQPLQLSVRWSINLINLATLDTTIEALASDSNVIYLPGAYVYPDDDSDNFTNLQELSATPPTDVNNSFSIPTSDSTVNPNGIDANGDGIADAQDDINGDNQVDSSDLPPTYNEGDRGPAGGWVIYVTDDGRSGLEVAPVDHGPLVRWYCDDEDLPGAVGHVASTGEQNSIKILEGCVSTGFVDAAVIADTYELNGFTDWFLPSISELDLIAEIVARGGLSFFDENTNYWSSSQYETSTSAWAYDIWDETQVLHERSDLLRVRAVRSF